MCSLTTECVLLLQNVFSYYRIFKALKGLSALVQTIINALPNMGNLVAFLMLFFFIWGVLGVQLYGNMCKAGDESLDQPLRSTRYT